MIDVNVSTEYDSGTRQELIEEKRPAPNSLSGLFERPVAPTLIEEAMILVEAEKEITDPIEFMHQRYPGRRLWRFILTHPDLDHMRGLKRLYEEVGFDNFWDSDNTKMTPSFRKGTTDHIDWRFYKQLQKEGSSYNRKTYNRGNALFAFGRDENGAGVGDAIEILSPTPELVHDVNKAAKSNDLSYVLRVHHAGRSVMLTGDVEEAGWKDIVQAYGVNLKSDFLSASHHGRDSGYYLPAVKLIEPTVCIVSVGRKPPTDASRKYAGQCKRVMSTRYYGNIELRIHDNSNYEWFVQRNADK